MPENRIETINQNVPDDLFNYQGIFDKPEIESFERNGEKIRCVVYRDSVGGEHFTEADALAELDEYCKNK